jgi:hypothetical protein
VGGVGEEGDRVEGGRNGGVGEGVAGLEEIKRREKGGSKEGGDHTEGGEEGDLLVEGRGV